MAGTVCALKIIIVLTVKDFYVLLLHFLCSAKPASYIHLGAIAQLRGQLTAALLRRGWLPAVVCEMLLFLSHS